MGTALAGSMAVPQRVNDWLMSNVQAGFRVQGQPQHTIFNAGVQGAPGLSASDTASWCGCGPSSIKHLLTSTPCQYIT